MHPGAGVMNDDGMPGLQCRRCQSQYSQSESTQQLSFISRERLHRCQLPTRTWLLVVTTQVLSNDIARRQVFVTTRYNAELVTLSTSRYYSHISTASFTATLLWPFHFPTRRSRFVFCALRSYNPWAAHCGAVSLRSCRIYHDVFSPTVDAFYL